MKNLYLIWAGLLLSTILVACGASGGADLTPPPKSCAEDAVLEYICWVDKFPESPGRVDVRCGFATLCCKETVQTWEYLYEKAAGPRGVADKGTIPTTASCTDTQQLLDLDNDGVPNVSDPDPTNTGDFQWE